jgi:hypothetical protein
MDMEDARGRANRLSDAGGRSEDDLDASRREILAKIGQFAYVAPALALLAEPKAVEAYNTRPGNGYGDTNHTHTGPPGQN